MLSVNIYFQLQYILSAHTRTTTPHSQQWVYLNTNNILSYKDETAGIRNNIKAKNKHYQNEQHYVPCKSQTTNAGLVF